MNKPVSIITVWMPALHFENSKFLLIFPPPHLCFLLFIFSLLYVVMPRELKLVRHDLLSSHDQLQWDLLNCTPLFSQIVQALNRLDYRDIESTVHQSSLINVIKASRYNEVTRLVKSG